MKRLLTTLTLACAVTLTGLSSGMSAPLTMAKMPMVEAGPTVVPVRHRGGDDFRRRGGDYYYHGHRGHRQRPGRDYRYYNGWWFPLAAFGVATAIAPQPRYVYREPASRYYARGLSPQHYRWCYDRYRSYRDYDNSYQPYSGPRRRCYSPYS